MGAIRAVRTVFYQAGGGMRDVWLSRGLGDVYKGQGSGISLQETPTPQPRG